MFIKQLLFVSKGGTPLINQIFFHWVEDPATHKGPINMWHTSHRIHYLTMCRGVMPKYTLEQSSTVTEFVGLLWHFSAGLDIIKKNMTSLYQVLHQYSFLVRKLLFERVDEDIYIFGYLIFTMIFSV